MEENNKNYYGFEYEDSNNLDQHQSSNDYSKKKINLKIPIIIMIIIILIIAITIFTVKGCNNNKVSNTDNNTITALSLTESNIEMVVGENKTIDVIIEATNPNAINFNWSSSNENVVIVNNGVINAISKGEATIIASHTTKSGKTYELKCEIIVKDNNNDNNDNNNTLKYSISDKNWTNNDVTITINNVSSFKELKYAINCSENCNYQKVNSNKIIVNQNGISNVTIVAVDMNNNTINETVAVKIDKNNPTLTIDNNSTIIYGNTNKIQVCATCTDKESGCEEDKVCDEYTSNMKNVCLSVRDKVGNVGSSQNFSVVIDKDNPSCVFSGPSTSSIQIGKTATFNLKCTDKTSGVKNRNLTASNFKINTSGIVKIDKVTKKAITNGYNYEITVTALANGKTTLTLNDNTISDNAGNKQTSVTSNPIIVEPTCTRKASCGCEYFTAWTLKGKVARTGSCSSPPNLTLTTERWINCGNVTSASGGTCNFTCEYYTRTCSTYKCC